MEVNNFNKSQDDNKDEKTNSQMYEKILNLQQIIDSLQTNLLEANNIINSQVGLVREKEMEIFNLKEQIDFVMQENASYDKLMGYSPHMTYQDKLKLNEDSERELERAKTCLDDESLKEYELAVEREDRLIDCALEQNQLQFEISEMFKQIKEYIGEEDYEEYKKYKRSYYTMIDGLYKMIASDTVLENHGQRMEMFDVLSDILEKHKKVYELDEEIKNLN